MLTSKGTLKGRLDISNQEIDGLALKWSGHLIILVADEVPLSDKRFLKLELVEGKIGVGGTFHLLLRQAEYHHHQHHHHHHHHHHNFSPGLVASAIGKECWSSIAAVVQGTVALFHDYHDNDDDDHDSDNDGDDDDDDVDDNLAGEERVWEITKLKVVLVAALKKSS